MSGLHYDYAQARHEPPIEEVLRDPIIRLLMAFDGVEEDDILPMVDAVSSETIC